MKELTSDTFDSTIKRKKVLLDFWADWCPHCNNLTPVLEKINEENYNTEIYKINVDNETELANNFGIHTLPTLIVLDDGKIVKRTSGFHSKQEIINLIL